MSSRLHHNDRSPWRRIMLAAVVLLLPATVHAQGTVRFESTLNGGQVVPPFGAEGDPAGSPFTGSAALELIDGDSGSPRLAYSIHLPTMDLDGSLTPGNFTDDVTAIHIHSGAMGMSGPHVLNVFGFSAGEIREDDAEMMFDVGLSLLTGIWDDGDQLFTGPDGMKQPWDSTALSAVVDELKAGDLYFQVHTLNYPNGELRGQITVVPEPRMSMLLGLGGLIGALGYLRRCDQKTKSGCALTKS